MRFGFTLRIATPDVLGPPAELVAWARAQGATIEIGEDPAAAVRGARLRGDGCLGQHVGRPRTRAATNLLAPYCVDERLMAQGGAGRGVHALPAGPSRRGSRPRR